MTEFKLLYTLVLKKETKLEEAFMKLLIALLFVLPLSVQAGHYKHKKSGYHRFHKNVKHYLTVGTALDFFSQKVGNEKTTSYAIQIGKGLIFKKKYDLSFLLGYDKNATNKNYNVKLATKYLFVDALSRHKKVVGTWVPYLGFSVGLYNLKNLAMGAKDKLKVFGVSAGNRFAISSNMMMSLEYAYQRGKLFSDLDADFESFGLVMNWNYFF